MTTKSIIKERCIQLSLSRRKEAIENMKRLIHGMSLIGDDPSVMEEYNEWAFVSRYEKDLLAKLKKR